MKKMNDRERTFLLMTIPILILFFLFNTLPLIKGAIYSFTNFFCSCFCCNNSAIIQQSCYLASQ